MASEKRRVFEKTSLINTTLDEMMRFHADPGALSKLTPPPIFMRVQRDDRRSIREGEIAFTLWFGPLPIRWLARHESGPAEHSFADRQIEGPMAHWRHEHIFEAASGGVLLTDRISYAHKAGLKGMLTRLMFDGLPLRFLFAYRHWRTRLATQRQR